MACDAFKAECVVIGAGVVGLAIAVRLAEYFKGDIIVLERSLHLGSGQSTRNSGVIHSGIYYEPSSLKASLSKRGNDLIYKFARVLDVPFLPTGKLIVASNEEELVELENLNKLAKLNDIQDVRWLSRAELQKITPNIQAVGSLIVPTAGLIDSAAFLHELRRQAVNSGIHIIKGVKIEEIIPGTPFCLRGMDKHTPFCLYGDLVINAAGLGATKIANIINSLNQWKINLVRGEYISFEQTIDARLFCSMPIYPTPKIYSGADKAKQTSLGVHLTPTINILSAKVDLASTVLIGPSVKVGVDEDDYESGRFSVEYFVEAVKPFFPQLKVTDCHLAHSGITPRLLDGKKDFIIERDHHYENCIHLVGIDSPGLTASLAIAEYVLEKFVLNK